MVKKVILGTFFTQQPFRKSKFLTTKKQFFDHKKIKKLTNLPKTVFFYKYQGAGNDFIMVDNRPGLLPPYAPHLYRCWCNRHLGIGADGLILIENDTHSQSSFKMVYYNADGYEGSMCGNGGRCAVAFAAYLGIISYNQPVTFNAADGLHEAIIQNYTGIVELKMMNVYNFEQLQDTDFELNTGSPHYVRFLSSTTEVDVIQEGKKIRYSPQYAEKGINVNFVQIIDNEHIAVKTYERGVEDETLACGTGVTACALMFKRTVVGKQKVEISTAGGTLYVTFEVKSKNNVVFFENIWLIGGAEMVFNGEIVKKITI